MPADENLRRLVHGGDNTSGGFTNTNSVYRYNSPNGGHHDLEYLMPVLNSATETIPWLDTTRCTSINGQGGIKTAPVPDGDLNYIVQMPRVTDLLIIGLETLVIF